MRTQPFWVTLSKPGILPVAGFLQNESHLHVSRRSPILVAFLKQSLYNLTDDLIEMVDQRIWKLYGEAKRAFEQERLKATQTINEKLQTLYGIGQILLNPEVEDNTVRTKAFEQISQVKLQIAIGETKQLIRPENDAYVDYFGKSYKRVRHFSSRFLATFQFYPSEDDGGLLKALQLVREIHAGTRRKLPDDAPIGFVPEAWRPYVIQPEGIDRRYYELSVLWVLRQDLRSGAIYLTHSRRFSELESYFIPKEQWVIERDQTINLLGTPLETQERLAERERELFYLMEAVETLLDEPDGDLRQEKGLLVLSPIEAQERSPQLKQLAHAISTRLPQLDITDLLVEVDSWTGFLDALKNLSGSSHWDNRLLLHLLAGRVTNSLSTALKPFQRPLETQRMFSTKFSTTKPNCLF